MTTVIPHDTKSTVQNGPGNPWSDFFGDLSGGNTVVNPMSTYARETLALPDVYKGSNPYLTNVMINIIEDEQLVPTRILLPIRQTQNETSITWDEFHFKSHLLGAVPEEGVSRLVQQQVSERRDHYVRYGLAFMIEHGFMQSEKGRMTYKMNLEQIRDAILQSLYIGVIEALLKCKSNTQVFTQCFGKTLTTLSARKRLDHEVESWGEIQKTEHGWDMLNSRAQKILKLNGVAPDAWVVDDGIKKYIAGVRRENFAYHLKGPAGPKLYDEQLGLGDPKSLDVAAGTLIFECKQFNIPEFEDPVNIMSRRRTIGEYAVSFPHVDFSACKQYSSAFRDVLVYDEDRDGWKKLSLMEGFKNCMRFDKHTGDLDFHEFDDGTDMFMHTDDAKVNHPMEYLGEMIQDNLSDQAVRDWTMSVVSGLENEVETSRDIAVMKKLVETLEAAPTNDQATRLYFKYVQAAHTCGRGQGAAYSGGAKLFDLTTGMLCLPVSGGQMLDEAKSGDELETDDDDDENNFELMFSTLTSEAHFIPYGYGSHAGIAELANPKYKTTYPKLHADAEQAMRGFNALVQRLEGICYDNLFMRSRSAPFFYKEKNIAAAVFANLVHERVPPVVVQGKVDSPGVPFSHKDTEDFDRGENSLRKAFMTLMNPATRDTSVVSGVGSTAAEIKKDEERKIREYSLLTTTAVERIMSACMLLSPPFRRSLYSHLKYFVNDALKDTGSETLAEDRNSFWEGMFKFVCTELAEYDKYQLTKTLGHSSGKPRNHHSSFCDFKAFLLQAKTDGGATETSTGPETELADQSVITQLTCSQNLANFFAAQYVDGRFQSYDAIAASTDGLAEIGAGEMFGEVVGASFNLNRFGLKRKQVGAGANYSFPVKETWNPIWVDGKLDARISRCKSLYTTVLHRAVSLALLGCPITYPALQHFIQCNVVFPFNIIYARPYMTYDMSTGVCMKSGNGTGETLVGHADFQLGDNVVQKLHYGNFTFHSKSVVYRQQNVYLAEDMFSTGYIGGDGTEFFASDHDMDEYNCGTKNRHKSIFAMLAPYSDIEYANPIDLTGKYSGDCQALNTDSKLHYATSPFYKKLWNWGGNGNAPSGRSRFETPDAAMNTVCFQGHQSMYNPSNSMMDVVIKNTGHWGDRVYPGCGKVRQGMSKMFDHVNYNNIYGGGGSTAATGMSLMGAR